MFYEKKLVIKEPIVIKKAGDDSFLNYQTRYILFNLFFLLIIKIIKSEDIFAEMDEQFTKKPKDILEYPKISRKRNFSQTDMMAQKKTQNEMIQ